MKPLLIVALIMLLGVPAHGASLRKQCRKQCKAAIDACVTTGGRRQRCKRDTLKRCRQAGLTECATAAATTTTTIASGGGAPTTTTTIPRVTLNGCDSDTATDLTGHPAVTITFGDADGFAYAPPCFIVTAGTQITFQGDFAMHPLIGGIITQTSEEQPDPASPFGGPTSAGTSKTLTLPTPGAFAFFCQNHGPIGMKGVAFVVP